MGLQSCPQTFEILTVYMVIIILYQAELPSQELYKADTKSEDRHAHTLNHHYSLYMRFHGEV